MGGHGGQQFHFPGGNPFGGGPYTFKRLTSDAPKNLGTTHTQETAACTLFACLVAPYWNPARGAWSTARTYRLVTGQEMSHAIRKTAWKVKTMRISTLPLNPKKTSRPTIENQESKAIQVKQML